MKHRVLFAVGMLAVVGASAAWADEPPAGATPAPTLVKIDAGKLRLLWPKFEKGQRVVLRQTAQKSRRGQMVIASRVIVDVLEKTGDEYVMRWRVGEIELPPNLPEDQRKMAAAMVAQMKSPAIDLVVKEGVGSVGLREWEKARDDVLALSEKLIKETPGQPVDAAKLESTMASMRGMMSTREATEGVLLKQVRPFFDGAYHEVAPGAERTEPVVLPMPMGGVKEWPAKRTIKLDAIDREKPDELTVRIDAALDKDGARTILQSVLEQVTKSGGDPKTVPAADTVDMGYHEEWVLDLKKGWPARVKYRTEQRVEDRGAWEELTWTLVEGPMPIPAGESVFDGRNSER